MLQRREQHQIRKPLTTDDAGFDDLQTEHVQLGDGIFSTNDLKAFSGKVHAPGRPQARARNLATIDIVEVNVLERHGYTLRHTPCSRNPCHISRSWASLTRMDGLTVIAPSSSSTIDQTPSLSPP